MIFLFDVDGVLVHNLGYRAALVRTVAGFSRRMGAGEHSVSENDIDEYESQSITVEWDSGAISVAAMLMARLRAAPPESAPSSPGLTLEELLDALGARPAEVQRPDFSALAQRVGSATPPGTLPALTALQLFSADLEGLPAAAAEFGRRALPALLARTYDIDQAPVMQVFQNHVLGHALYQEYYGLEPQMQGEPLLQVLDQPLLRPEARAAVLAGREGGRLFPVIYTARPSLAPREVDGRPRGFTPEAEIGQRLAGLDGLPVMGFGKLDWWARRVGLTGSDLVKPSPVEAMAAIGAAISGQEVEALKAAYAVFRGDHLRPPLTAAAGRQVHVFEDSASSLRAVTCAVELLNRQGLNLRLTRHGIALPGSHKQAALADIADQVHPDVNLAVQHALGE